MAVVERYLQLEHIKMSTASGRVGNKQVFDINRNNLSHAIVWKHVADKKVL